MEKKNLKKAAWAAAALIVPGGLILGALFAANSYRKKHAGRTIEPVDTDPAD